MATYVGVGVSLNLDSFAAGKESAGNAYLQIRRKKPNLSMVFASSRYDQDALLKGIQSILGMCPLVGCSGAGQISPSGIAKRSAVIICINSDRISFSTGMGRNLSLDSRGAGQCCARETLDKKSMETRGLFLMFPDGLTPNGQDLIRGGQEIFGSSFPIVGASAGDELQFKNTYQYYGSEVHTDSVVGVLIGEDSKIGIGASHGWRPIGKSHIATKASGNRLLELDNKPAVHFYEEYFKGEIEELKDQPLARVSLQYPLGMAVPDEDEYLLRNILKSNPDGSLLCAGEITEGSEIRLMLGNKESAISAARFASAVALERLKSDKPKFALVFDSVARLKLLGNDAQKEIDTIRQIIGPQLPIAGFYTYGEQAPLKADIHLGRSYFHNETVLVVIVGE